jgi:hypothetical protein
VPTYSGEPFLAIFRVHSVLHDETMKGPRCTKRFRFWGSTSFPPGRSLVLKVQRWAAPLACGWGQPLSLERKSTIWIIGNAQRIHAPATQQTQTVNESPGPPDQQGFSRRVMVLPSDRRSRTGSSLQASEFAPADPTVSSHWLIIFVVEVMLSPSSLL